MLRAVIFDFDGTLADTIPAITEGVNLTMRQYGFPTHSEAEVRTFINNGPRMLIRRALPRELQENECLLDRVLADYDRLYKTVCLHTDTPYDGINALIDRLRERGVRIGVLSNKQDHLLRKICTGMFGDRIDCIVGTVPDRPTKPDPYLAKKLAESLGVDTRDCIMIGDSDVDIRTAENAEMQCISVSWGYRDREFLLQNGAKAIASTPEELSLMIENRMERID
ncbi:MAG: HAD family hydrolase [Clostridia bacterium]|nr:HAD family hydrolase [Clostridia bacterium]